MFAHKTLDFLDVHQDRQLHVQKVGVNTSYAFVVATGAVSCKNKVKISSLERRLFSEASQL